MARTPLFANLRRLMRAATLARRTGVPAAELIELPRRRFMQAVGGVAAMSLAGAGCSSTGPKKVSRDTKVVIVGGGMAGLHCGHLLRKQGVDFDIYEASDRTGGRMFTKKGILFGQQTVELGGEFIDSHHADMHALVKELKLELLDMHDDKGMRDAAYFFGGKHYTDREVLDALAPFVERMEQDAARLDADWDLVVNDINVRKLDRTGIGAYLSEIGMTGWLKALIEVAFVTEYGLDADEQSVFNLLGTIGLDTSTERWESFGESDERYKVKGGNQRVVDELARKLASDIYRGHKLLRVKASGDRYLLTFDDDGRTVEVKADIVVLAIPFTTLRQVELQVDMPAGKRKCIDELGYGMNAKVLAGVSSRPWRKQGYSGGIFTDGPVQLAWDNARMQAGDGAGITFYSGGKPGIDAGKGTPREHVLKLLPELDKAFPGAEGAFNNKLFRMHWPSHAFTKCSYACYKPGQWTTLSGLEIEPVGNLLFAGEHCSDAFQGYMNGAAETGRVAAEAVIARVSK
ncbi:MAG: FAD-dependent oxidoreductase [Planctomycetes bacterium]|nr:FAD-dependent oxidoreductase [Planctomycetota bacterium]MCW8136904.1 FAD-dependent oxidoreductase [Planctomycetota bacterium]